jgi:hypothetical protein
MVTCEHLLFIGKSQTTLFVWHILDHVACKFTLTRSQSRHEVDFTSHLDASSGIANLILDTQQRSVEEQELVKEILCHMAPEQTG